MSNLFNAVNSGNHRTLNGAATHGTTNSACLDFYSIAGASRGKDISTQFSASYREDPSLTLKILFWLRDVRGGAGERTQFRNLITQVVTDSNVFAVMRKIVELGRWDDLHVFLETKYDDLMVSITADALVQGNALAAKWTPRKGVMFNQLRKKMELTPKELRKLLVNLSNTVEQKMSAGNWSEIDYSKLPSVASSRYMTAFHRNDATRYEAYKDALVKGETKINAGAVYPYDITKAVHNSSNPTVLSVAEAQWNALPNYMEGVERRVLPVIDVSSSMNDRVGGNPNLTCMDVAVSLGLYLAERNNSVFKDHYITFHESPSLMKATGTLAQKLRTIYSSPWGGNTNLMRVFSLILNAAIKNSLSEDDMPTDVIICSDMEFDRCDRSGYATTFTQIKKAYNDAGYKMPTLIFWRLNVLSDKNFPVKDTTFGAKLISGFSPSMIKTVLTGTSVSSYDSMLEVVDVPRYTI